VGARFSGRRCGTDLGDALDEVATILLGEVDGEVVATARMCFGADGALNEEHREEYELDRVLARASADRVIAYPNGSRSPSDDHRLERGTRSWDGTGAKDIGYLDAVIDDMSAKYPVDPKRIYVGGISNGGYMAYRYACDPRSGWRRSWFTRA
jgi:hypothetical protein